ncbi:cytochrome P450 [Ramlibacter sp. WS9]|uniref:cytochrome P450 n=1 Tax=Ramlibacter sp. WS9 TaxID=1882741 RepID=UPI001143C1A9|nr:cytochrome P450 [Ramlibacter sp. WS9]ROZ66096.1 cytochrome P450 [Ramlibacter sp. WS9]
MGAIPRIQDFDDAAYDPFVSDEAAFGDCIDPYLRLAEWREQGPVHKMDYRAAMGLYPDVTMAGLEHYLVLGYDATEKIFLDPVTFSNKTYARNLGISFGRSVSTMDAPEHSRFRKIFQKAFLPNVVAKWGDTLVDPVVQGLMDQFSARGKADLVQEFTHHYPFHIIYRQLNLPPDDVKVFHKLAIAQTVVMYDVPHGTEASRKLGLYFKNLLDERRRNPGDDLVSLLALAEADGEQLPEEILVSFLRQLVNAGGDTTYRATSVLLTGLLSNPDQLDAVRQDRSLIPQAIEEALRWDGPVLIATRTPTVDTELCGVKLPAGACLSVASGSANRDPSRFENPDRFDIFRKKQRNFGFAFGPHVCIGQHLARIEMTRALNAILDRLKNIRLDPALPAPVIQGTMMRVPKHIHVLFD